MKIAPEGYPFVFFFLGLLIAGVAALGWKGGAPPLALLLFMLYFFRDPERTAPVEPGYVAPADGRVIVAQVEEEPEYLKRRAMKVSIFMSPMNVHVNRAPCQAEVKTVRHSPGKYLAAYKDDAPIKNERTDMLLSEPDGTDILVKQVAGFVARRTVCRKSPGDSLARGERFGLIKFSSRVDIYLPESVELKVKVGDTVRAGESIIAR